MTGQAVLAEGCDADGLRALIYEVPDAEGVPRFDVLVLTSPGACAAGSRKLDLNVTVATPQPPRGRFVYVVNEAHPAPRALD